MDAPKRKFRSEINTKNINELLEKRQRKRFSKSKSTPYSKHNTMTDATSPPGEPTVIQGIPRELLPMNKKSLNESVRREYDKPEHWIAPKEVAKRSRDEIFQAENKNITKSIRSQSVCSYADKLLSEANRQKLKAPSSFLTAKGYISRRIDNGE